MMISNAGRDFWFRNSNFKLFSKQFLILFLLSFILSYLGIFFTIFLPFMLLFSPFLWYYLFGWLPFMIIKVGQSRLSNILDYIPFVKFKGVWLMDRVSTNRDLNTWQDFKIFLKKYFSQFAIINTGVLYFFYQIDTIAGSQFSQFNVQTNWLVYFVVLNLLGMIFVVVTVLEDVEIRVLETYENRVVRLVDLAYSFKGLFIAYFGIRLLTSIKAERGTEAFEQILNNIFLAILLGVGIPLFMSFIFYKSKFHEYIVNDIREELLNNNEKYDLIIGEVKFDKILCNNCHTINTIPNYYCRSCGQDIRRMNSPIFEQPVRVGSLIYEDQLDELDIDQIQQENQDKEPLWNKSRKRRFILSLIIPGLLILGVIVLFGFLIFS